MVKLNLLFVLLSLILFVRFMMFGAFNPWHAATIFLFPATAFVIYLVSKWMARKEATYQPPNHECWSFYFLQRTFLNKKQLFKGEGKRGSIQQYFTKKWQYFVSDFFDLRWYLSLRIYIGGDSFDVRWKRSRRFSQQEQWLIYKNGVVIGKANTGINVKNMAKLKEVIIFELGEETWTTSALTVTSSISLMKDNRQEGVLRRNHLISNVQAINVTDDRSEYIMSLILHSYYFK
ncbi:hypothetical protein [Cytobacillus sp. FSL K6-0265]|uniref:hypothetical protein n=1 Tax=Cytobacillus sp. FSL K6-0265 TaxID=2921448 RepID=UPI0030F9DD9B